MSASISASSIPASISAAAAAAAMPPLRRLTRRLSTISAFGDQAKEARRVRARSRLRRRDLVIGGSSLAAAAAVLPIASTSPEAASVLAVASVALLAGQRWALGVVIVAELALIAALLPMALHSPMNLGTAAAWFGMLAAVPGLMTMRRGAAALALIAGLRRTRATCRIIHALLVALAMLCSIATLV